MDHNRRKRLGDLGESIAISLLERAGFTKIRSLNADQANYPFADLYAERGERRFAISVKARNRYIKSRHGDTTRVENSRFKLGGAGKCRELAQRACKNLMAEGAWLIIRYEERVLDAYFGTLQLLDARCAKPPAKGILTGEAHLKHYERLAEGEEHGLSYEMIRNA